MGKTIRSYDGDGFKRIKLTKSKKSKACRTFRVSEFNDYDEKYIDDHKSYLSDDD